MHPVSNDAAEIEMNMEFEADSLEKVMAIVNKVNVLWHVYSTQ
jgi:hypothetical protein